MLIYDVLKKDHQKLKTLLRELVALPASNTQRRKSLVQKIRDELVPHSRAEEAVFYNSLRTAAKAKGKVLHSYREHMEAEALLRALQMMDFVDLGWKTIARQLKSAVEHHIREEENEIFPLAREILTEQEAEDIAVTFRRLKTQVKKENFLTNTMNMVANLMPPRLSKPAKLNERSMRH